MTRLKPSKSFTQQVFGAYFSSRPMTFTTLWDGRVAVVFGCAPALSPKVGIPWLLGTDLMLSDPQLLLRYTGAWLDYFQHFYPTLHNYAHEDNHVVLKFLEHAGFTLDPLDNGVVSFWRIQE
jgi:hypothetical protein